MTTQAERGARDALRESMRLNGDVRKGKEPMDSQRIINVLAGLVLAFLGWWSNNIWQTMQTMQMQVTSLNVELARNYVPRVELQANFDHINAKLDAIDRQTKGGR